MESTDGKHRLLSGNHLSTIIVANYYPYTFINDQGHVDGFSVDLIRAVVQVMGLEIDIQTGAWDQARAALETGKINLLPMMAYSEERARVYDFSAPHTISFDAVFVVKGRNRIQSLIELADKTVIVMKNDAAHDYLISRGIALPEKLVLTDSLPEALEATHKSLFDGSLQGISHRSRPAFSFQGHPEASPGPHDVARVFDRFIDLMKARA